MRILRKATEFTIVALFCVLIAAVLYQVVARYVFQNPPSWTEELARYCQVWIVLLTSAVCIRKGSHLAVDYFSHRFDWRIRRIVEIIVGLLTVAYISIVTVSGWRLMIVGAYQLSPALQVPMSWIYAIFPLSGLLMLSEALIVALRPLQR